MNVLQSPSHRANLSKSGFDMSQLTKFSSTTGELLPIYYDILYPGDKVSVSTVLRTRTMPLNSAAMTSITEHIDWFAVPLDQIYRLFSMQFYGINDINSSLFNSLPISNVMPFIDAQEANNVMSNAVSLSDAYFNGSNVERKSLRGTSVRLLELLGLPINNYTLDSVEQFRYAINPMLLCAYQKIYFDYFRLADREQNNPDAYNLDESYSDNLIGNTTDMIRLRYRAKARDFFTHTYVSPLFSTGGISGGTSNLIETFRNWLAPVHVYESDSSATLNPVSPTTLYPSFNENPGANAYQKLNASLTPSFIRSTFALSKLLEITRRAGKHVDQQTLAHFGVKPSSFVTGEVMHLAHHQQKIMIGDVISTAETEEAALGKVAGKGYGYDTSKPFRYKNECQCPVILMGIYSAEVAQDYKQNGIDKFNLYVDNADWARPEFDNLGMQPLFGYQSFYNPTEVGTTFNNSVLSWQFRWMESKLKYNRLCGALARSLDYWTTYTSYMTSNLSSFLVSPFALDSIMVSPYKFDAPTYNTLAAYGTEVEDPDTHQRYYVPSNAFMDDPLLHELYCNVKKSSFMSSFGLEQL